MLPAILAFLTLAAAPDDATPKPRIVRVAVNDLAVTDVDARVARVVADSLVVELRKLERVDVTDFQEVRQMLSLESEKQTLGCEANEECLAQIADALGVDYLVVGSLARVGDTHVIGLRLLDQRAGRAAKTFNKVVSAESGVEFLAEVGPAVEALFPDVALRPGQVRGISEEMARRLTPPPLPAPLFWTAAALSGGLALGAGAAGSLQLLFQGEYKDSVTRAQNGVESGAALVATGNRAQAAEVAGWSLLAAAVLTGGLAAAVVPLTDFENAAGAGGVR